MSDPTLQKLAMKAILSLPTPLLRALSGGGAVYRGGRTLDPRLQFLAHLGRRLPPITDLSPDEARTAAAEALALVAGGPEPGVRTESLAIDGPNGSVRLRAYRPADQDSAAPLMVFAHLGGGVIGDLDACHAFCGILARLARCAVLSVDYRLAPDHRFPAGLEDVAAAYRWGRDNAARFGALPGTAAIGGEAMGGNFAAVIAQDLRRAGQAQPALQLLICPVVDVASETPSMTTQGDAFPLSAPVLSWLIGHYMGPEADPADPRLSPAKSADLAGLAPAVVITAGFDPLVDQGEAYAQRLAAAGTPTTYRRHDGLAHGFTAFTGASPVADAACREIAQLVRAAYDRPLDPPGA